MRKLAIACGAFSAAIFLAQYVLPSRWLFPLALSLVLSGIGLILLRRRWLLPVIISLCALSAGLYIFGMHQMLTLDRAHDLDGQEVSCGGRVLSEPVKGNGWARAEVLLKIDERTSLKSTLFSDALIAAKPGDVFEGSFSLRSADVRNGERYDTNPARGIYLTARQRGDLRLTGERSFSLRGFASALNGKLCERIRLVFPEDTYAFFQALMLGEKSDLYDNDTLHLRLSRAGLMHMVAVSGMHIAFLVGMLRQLLGNTRRASLLSILLIWCFVLLTGSTPSAVRAGVMQTIALLAPIFGREDDPPTSLLFALALILLQNPFAAGSVSLQLSFSSLSGIELFSDRIRNAVLDTVPKRLPWRIRNYLSSNMANSIGVLVFTTPMIALHFAYVSTLSPLTNMFTLWAVPICFGAGYLCCLVSLIFLPAAQLMAWIVSWLARFIVWIAGVFSAPGFSCLYLCLKWNWLWLALVYALFIGAAILLRKSFLRWVYPTVLAVFSLFVLLTATRLYYGNAPGYMTAVNVGQGQSLVVFSGEETVVIDCGNINSLDDAGDLTGTYLCSRGREDIDLLVLTHLHADHADGVARLMAYLPVREILIGPEMEDPNGLMLQIIEAARRTGTTISILRNDRSEKLGSIALQLFVPGEAGEINERCVTATIGIGGYDLLVTGDINMTAERELMARQDLKDIEVLVVGHHGSKYASCPELLESIGADTAIVSCGYNSFGHPTPETLERLDKYGYTVYRTDIDGTLEFRVP